MWLYRMSRQKSCPGTLSTFVVCPAFFLPAFRSILSSLNPVLLPILLLRRLLFSCVLPLLLFVFSCSILLHHFYFSYLPPFSAIPLFIFFYLNPLPHPPLPHPDLSPRKQCQPFRKSVFSARTRESSLLSNTSYSLANAYKTRRVVTFAGTLDTTCLLYPMILRGRIIPSIPSASGNPVKMTSSSRAIFVRYRILRRPGRSYAYCNIFQLLSHKILLSSYPVLPTGVLSRRINKSRRNVFMKFPLYSQTSFI